MKPQTEKPKVTALDIKRALATYHKDDFFIAECKNGPTHMAGPEGLLIMDGVAFGKTWTNPWIRIYEIKVSRSDFLADTKFYRYAEYGNELVLVCPKGLIQREELPESFGLMEFDGRNLRYKRQPVRRKPFTPSPEMLMYVLMNRLDGDRDPFFSDRARAHQAYVEGKKLSYETGRQIARRVRELEHQLKERRDNLRNLEFYQSEFHALRQELRTLGIDPLNIKRDIEALSGGLTPRQRKALAELGQSLERTTALLKDMF